MSLDKKDVLSDIEKIALKLGVPPEKSALAANQMFNSMVKASVLIDKEGDRYEKKM